MSGKITAAILIIGSVCVLMAGCRARPGAGAQSPAVTSTEEEQVSATEEENIVTGIITGVMAQEIRESNSGVIMLDVRNPDEYNSGHVEGAILIPVGELESRLSELPDKDAIIILYCRSGMRSASAFIILANNGYTNVYDMQRASNWPGDLVEE